MFYCHADIGGSGYVLWKRLTTGKKIGLGRLPRNLSLRKRGYRICGIGDLSLLMNLVKLCPDINLSYNFNWGIRRASQYGHLHIIKWLCSVGCDPSSNNNSAFQWACGNGHMRVIKWLYNEGYNIDAGFAWAVRNGHLRVVKWLYKMGCDPTINTNIHTASSYGHLRLVKWLCKMGCDPMSENNTAICFASTYGHLHVVKWLYSVGCDPKVRSNYAIRWASVGGHLRVVQWLYSIGCDPTDCNNYAIGEAISYGHAETVEWLYSVGCDPSDKDIMNARLWRSRPDVSRDKYDEYTRIIEFLGSHNVTLAKTAISLCNISNTE